MVIMTPEVAESLSSLAEGLGLAATAPLPLMVLRQAPRAGADPEGLRIQTVSEVAATRSVGDLISNAFGLPRAAVARVLEGTMGRSGGAEVYLAHLNDTPMSSVSITMSGETAGIWSMATPKAFRGRGVGSALLGKVIARLRSRGVKRLFLLASKDGRRLYENMGFETLCECQTWVLPMGEAPAAL
jgi:GNAT superfamily N-acetyltransferase